LNIYSVKALVDTFCQLYHESGTKLYLVSGTATFTTDYCPPFTDYRLCSIVPPPKATASEAMCPRSSRGKGTFSTIAALIQGAQLAGAASVFITGGSFYW